MIKYEFGAFLVRSDGQLARVGQLAVKYVKFILLAQL
jgi:hypothetical protein